MGVVQNFVSNTNQTWLRALRTAQIKVQCTIPLDTKRVNIRILCRDRFCRDMNDTRKAWDLFNSWGLLDLTCKGDMDFIIAFEQQSNVKIDKYQVKNSIVREVRMPRPSRRAKPS